MNWDLLERRIASSEKAYQRQIIRTEDRGTGPVLRAVPSGARPAVDCGRVIISCDEKLTSSRSREGASIGRLKVPEREGILRAIDGQHRLLALHADIETSQDDLQGAGDHLRSAARRPRRPDVRDDQRQAHAAERIAPGQPSGRQLYRDDALAAAHDVVRALNDREDSPLHGEIKLLGVGHGRVAQAPLAQELKKLFAGDAFGGPRSRPTSATTRNGSS